MANWKVTISGKNIRKASVEKLAAKLKEEFGEGAQIHVSDNTPPESRQDRFQAAVSQVEDAKGEAEELKGELENWKDNLPEQFQDGEKGQQIDEAVDALDNFINDLDSAIGNADVNFPGMYS